MNNKLRPRYSATLTCDEIEIACYCHNNLEAIIAELMVQLEAEKAGSVARVIDNETGDIVHQCCKVATEV